MSPARAVTDTDTPTLSVSQLNRKAKTLLESHFDFVWVEGELSNFARPGSGHWYFTLKDDGAQVRCAMFRGRNSRVRFQPGNGDQIRLRARVSLYEGRGEFQLVVEFMEPAGAGALQARFEQLREQLRGEGLLDPARKRPLPTPLRHVALITSRSGAAVHDVLTVLERRNPLLQVSVLPVAVQGRDAPDEIVAAITSANRWRERKLADFDLVLLARGGGSLEDLQAFNDERVARAIVASALPVVSAVGHETDLSIADMVADQRGATPSAAAELISPDQTIWQRTLAEQAGALQRAISRRLQDLGRELGHRQRRLRHPERQLRERAQRLDDLEQRLLRTQQQRLTRLTARLTLLASSLREKNPVQRLRLQHNRVDSLHQRLQRAAHSRLRDRERTLGNAAQRLQALSPLATLQRGYSILSTEDDRIVRRADAVAEGQTLRARLAEGELRVRVLARRPES
jgi:exodeoxyribonuclease VII large subunit